MAKNSAAKKRTPVKIKRLPKSAAQIIADKAAEIGVPANQVAHGGLVLVDVPKLDKGARVTTTKTLINNGGTPVARWKAARLLSASQVAAIDHCEQLWSQLNGKSLVAKYDATIPGGGTGNGWAEQEALDALKRIKDYFPVKWWSIFESVCRFDEPAGFAGSRLTECQNDRVAAARTTVQFVADIIAMKEHLSY
jgi:hypothetical protein